MDMEDIILGRKPTQLFWRVFWVYFKILLLIGVNVLAFLPLPQYYLWSMFLVELFLAVLLQMDLSKSLPILKFLVFNFIPIYLLLYFVDFNWLNALIYLGEITSIIGLLLISILIFNHITPRNELFIAISKSKMPKRMMFVVVIVLTFIPTISAQIHVVVQHQKARGYKVNIFHLKPILVPVILHLLDLSRNLSLSLESRGLDL